MAKTLNTRIQLKRDSLTNWNESSLVLKPGELAVAYVDVATQDNKGNIIHVPTALLKAGENVENSTKTFKELPFVSAIAADVYAWAKEAGFYVETVGEGEAIADVEFKATETHPNGALVVTKIDLVTPQELTNALANYYTKAEIDALIEGLSVGALEDRIADVETAVTTTLPGQINAVDAKFAEYTKTADLPKDLGDFTNNAGYAKTADVNTELEKKADKTQVATDIANAIAPLATTQALEDYKTANNAAVALKANAADVYTKTEADDAFMTQDEVDARVNKVITDAVDGDALTSLTELVQYINTHGGEAANMAVAIENIEKQLDGIDAGTGTVKKYIDDAITALKIGDYAKASDLADLAARVKAIEDAPYATTGNVATAKQEAINAAAGDAANKYATIVNHNALAERVTATEGVANNAAAKAGENATAIGNLDTAYKAADELINAEVAKKANDADLAAIAKTGNVNDLVQTANDVLVFDCGTSSTIL